MRGARFVSSVRHPIRAVAMALVALSIAWGMGGTHVLLAAALGAVAGVFLGEMLGRSSLRTNVAILGQLLAFVVALFVSDFLVSNESVASLFGPAGVLDAAAVIRYATFACMATAALRVIALRWNGGLALELGAIVSALAGFFSVHRDGVIARPLWLSDWAWQRGIDPAQVLLFIGAAAVVVLAGLLVAEARSGISLSVLFLLPLLALVVVSCLEVTDFATPKPADGLGLTTAEQGEPPRPSPDGERPGEQGGSDADSGGSPASARDAGVTETQHDLRDGTVRDASRTGSELDASTGQNPPDANQGDASAQGARPDAGSDAGAPPMPRPQPMPPNEQFRESQAPSNSPAPMAIVLLESDYSPPSEAYYFRQAPWSQFQGTRLVPTTRDDVDGDTMLLFPVGPSRVRTPPRATDRTRVRAKVAMLVEHTQPFALESPVRFSPLPNASPERFVRMYHFESLSQNVEYRKLLGRTAGDPAWTPDVKSYYLTAPSDPRYRKLADEILRELPESHRNDPFAKALTIKLWFDRAFTYSSKHRHANAADPTADFLFGNRTGYCVHFAHAAVFLWRSVGIPSRIGTGYMVEEANRAGGSAILIRSGDAHAWPELYLSGVGWVVLDVHPARNLDPPGSPVDDDLQRLLGEMARDAPPAPEEEIDKPPGPRPRWGRNLGLSALSLLALALLALYGMKIWRRFAPVVARTRGLPRVGYRRALDKLAEVGISREFGETREQFARRAATVAPSFGKLTEMHVAARLRRKEATGEPREELSPVAWRATMAAVDREIPARVPFWRRVLGWMHPTSFFDAR